MTAAAILAIALSFRAPVASEEPRPNYEARVGTIAEAIRFVSRTPEDAAAVLVLFYRESTFRLDVHDGTTKGDDGRAACLGQLWPHVPEWDRLTGTDLAATTRCAAHTIRLLRSAERRCGGTERDPVVRQALAYEGYAHGTCRVPSFESWSRARAWARVSARIRDFEMGGQS